MNLNISSAHNGYLETFISFGYLGVALLGLVIVSFIKKIANGLVLSRPDGQIVLPFVAGLFFIAIFGNLTESFFFTQNGFFNMSWALAYVLISSWVKAYSRSLRLMDRSMVGGIAFS